MKVSQKLIELSNALAACADEVHKLESKQTTERDIENEKLRQAIDARSEKVKSDQNK